MKPGERGQTVAKGRRLVSPDPNGQQCCFCSSQHETFIEEVWTIESWDRNIAEGDLLADLLTLLIVRAGTAIMTDRWCLAGFN